MISRMIFYRKLFVVYLVTFTVFSVASETDISLDSNRGSYSPYADRAYPTRVYWGDTHLHTNLSVDSYLYSNVQLGSSEAYRFARGEAVPAHNGMPARLRRVRLIFW